MRCDWDACIFSTETDEDKGLTDHGQQEHATRFGCMHLNGNRVACSCCQRFPQHIPRTRYPHPRMPCAKHQTKACSLCVRTRIVGKLRRVEAGGLCLLSDCCAYLGQLHIIDLISCHRIYMFNFAHRIVWLAQNKLYLFAHICHIAGTHVC